MKTNLFLFLGLLAAAPAWADYPGTVLADNPAGYWRLGALPANNITTNLGFIGSAGDATNTGTLTLNSDSPVVGGGGSSINFDAGGLIALPYSPKLSATNAFSYEVWYNEDPGSSGIRCPLWFRDEPVRWPSTPTPCRPSAFRRTGWPPWARIHPPLPPRL